MAGIAYGIQVSDKSAARAIEQLGGDMNRIRRKVLARVGVSTVAYVQSHKLRGDPLHRQSGHLAQGLHYSFIAAFSIFIAPSVKYGAIHEYGGVIKPVNATILRFIGPGGDPVFAREVTIPARPWLAPGISEYLKSGAADRLVDTTLQDELDRISRSVKHGN